MTAGSANGNGASVAPPALHFATGKIGCLLPVMACVVLFFGAAAVRPGLLETEGRHEWLADAVRPLSWNGINIPVLLLCVWLLWELARLGSRWAGRVAVEARRDGLTFHWTLLRRRKVPWQDLRGVHFLSHIAGKGPPQVRFDLKGWSIFAKPVNNEDGAAERFVQAVRAHLESLHA